MSARVAVSLTCAWLSFPASCALQAAGTKQENWERFWHVLGQVGAPHLDPDLSAFGKRAGSLALAPGKRRRLWRGPQHMRVCVRMNRRPSHPHGCQAARV